MKKKTLYTIFGGLFFLSGIFSGCDESNNLGMDLLPSTDLINVKCTILKDDISSFTFNEDSVKTDEPSRSLLGSFNDPVFGNTTIDFATQVRLQSFPDYGNNPGADSIKLYLYYRGVYGDTSSTQTLKIYELESPISYDADYYQDTDLKSYASTELLAEYEFKPQISQDSTTGDTLYQLLKIPLDISLAEKLVGADSTDMINNDIFLDFFKGLYIEPEKRTEGGSILSLEASSTDAFQGSAIAVYYNNDETREYNADTTAADTSYMMPYIISSFSARVNSISHDYTTTTFVDNLNQETGDDSLIFIQSTGGLKSKINIDNLSNWKDSSNTAINKAELIFQVDTIASDIDTYSPPSQLLFTVVDEDGKEFLPIDYVFNPTFYGGYLRSDYTYHFNITQHLQQIIDGTAENNGFFLTTAQKNQANRVVLKGSHSVTGIKLVITYSKFLQ